MKRPSDLLFAGSILAFAASLFTPAYVASESTPGWAALISGVFGLFSGFFCWLANPLLLLAWAASQSKKSSPVPFAVGALLLTLEFLRHDSISVDENGGKGPIVSLGIGYWLWVSAPLLMILHAVFRHAPPEEKAPSA